LNTSETTEMDAKHSPRPQLARRLLWDGQGRRRESAGFLAGRLVFADWRREGHPPALA